MLKRLWLAGLLAGLVSVSTVPAHAIHFYRGTGSGCSAADGPTTDDPTEPAPGPVTATVKVTHNLFIDSATNSTTTTIKAGEAVRWTWNSSHCHSVQTSGAGFNSGFHYPTAPPESPQVAPGVFDYPVLDDTPTLSFTHTFRTPGTYTYFCVHHQTIGMSATVTVL